MLRSVRLAGVAVSAIALLGVATLSTASASPEHNDDRRDSALPLVLGHRGASGYRPEHTLAAYELAARMGADYIEPDLVPTKDGVLVARHEPEIGGTTDVANHPEFADRKATKNLDGVQVTGWWTEDFTLAELKTLRAVERIPALRPRNTVFNGRYEVPTLQEVIDLSKRLSRELRRDIGIYPETKHPTYFRKLGLELEPKLVWTLTRNGLNHPRAKVFVQSFEVSNLKALKGKLRVPLIQLTSANGAPYDFVDSGDPRKYADLITPAGLREVATYASGIGPAKDQVIPRDAAGNLTAPTALVGNAHAAGLKVHPYTFRVENNFLPTNLRSSANPADAGNLFGELSAFWAAGVDGLFTDNSDIAVESRTEHFAH
ncbi:Glycerophosphoryl diester phosphodiesterase [Alloactinosynnema sp. L-07]|uniref:glycerophosphodiester phosphodiesterase n=1 Tax=Alloactinosynnema sp. L-07 TaxID=1653480 RepID=UPI00065F030A|nr:glycerophosphodiester phosphodiesterase [Alloactinosynnema sp. L-07]CRK60472.1 Glycerophosphoryl diester phosphodiesterase [Alloactinosynnema sp. L-07]